MLKTIKIKNETFKVAVANDKESRAKGLGGLEKLGKNKGMLFVFDEPIKVEMVMDGMLFDLDFIFLDSSWEIIQLGSLEKGKDKAITSVVPCAMVLEVNKGVIERLGLTEGLTLEPEEDLKEDPKTVIMYKSGGSFQRVGDVVLNPAQLSNLENVELTPGKLLILGKGGEVVTQDVTEGARIFSIPHTKKLLDEAKKRNDLNLAKAFIEILDIQNTQSEDYVKN
jgi:uncharacterized membrane protein (UPF0127 family)